MEESKKVVVLAGLRVKKGFAEEFLRAAFNVVSETRKEAGCLRYDLLIDVLDTLTFHFVEEYEDDAAFEAHRKQPYMDAFREVRARVVDEYLGVSTLKEVGKR